MIRFIQNLYRKWQYQGAVMTPKGECFRRYCEKYVENEQPDFIKDYEDTIDTIRLQIAEKDGVKFTNKEIAELILTYFEEYFPQGC